MNKKNSTRPLVSRPRISNLAARLASLLLLSAILPHCGKEPKDILGTEESRFSQVHEEVVIRDFFQDRRDGFFVDIGCAHFKTHSTTLYLERYLGWSGIAVDAIDAYRKGFDDKRPKTKFFNYIVTDHSGTTEPFYKLGQYYLMSTHVKDYAEKVSQGDYEIIELPTITIDELLEKNGVEKIDFLSMDIEAGEPAALAGFDIERYAPELVCVESHPPIRPQLLEYFTAHNYRRIDRYSSLDNGLNWYFTPAEE